MFLQRVQNYIPSDSTISIHNSKDYVYTITLNGFYTVEKKGHLTKNKKVTLSQNKMSTSVYKCTISDKYVAVVPFFSSNILIMKWKNRNIRQITTQSQMKFLKFNDDSSILVTASRSIGVNDSIVIYSTENMNQLHVIPMENSNVMINDITIYDGRIYYICSTGEKCYLQVITISNGRSELTLEFDFFIKTILVIDDEKFIFGTEQGLKNIVINKDEMLIQNYEENMSIPIICRYKDIILTVSRPQNYSLDTLSVWQYSSSGFKKMCKLRGSFQAVNIYEDMIMYSGANNITIYTKSINNIDDNNVKIMLRNITLKQLYEICQDDQVNALRYVFANYIHYVLEKYSQTPKDPTLELDQKKKSKHDNSELLSLINRLMIDYAGEDCTKFLEHYKILIDDSKYPTSIQPFIVPWLLKLKY